MKGIMVVTNFPNSTNDTTTAVFHKNELPPAQGKERRRRLKKSLKLLPNIFTLSNAFFGFCALVFSAQRNPQAAAYCILLGASMDALDGRIARLTHNTSPLGMQLDSLSDAISFIVAPAFMICMWDFSPDNIVIFCASSLYLLAGIFRLARFNVTSQTQLNYSLGLPSTLAGCALAAATLTFPLKDNEFLLPIIMVSLAYLMVSKWRFPTFKQASKKGLFTSSVVLAVATVTLGFTHTFFVLIMLYLAISAATTFRLKQTKQSKTL